MKRLAVLLVLMLPAMALAAPPPIQSQKLDNGLEVLVVEDHSLPLITVEIGVKNGSMTEPPDYNGLSHLYEHMFFKANAVIPSQEAYLVRIRELGMQFNGGTDTERVDYFFTTTADHTADAMVFMRDAITSPLFDQKELERERAVIGDEISRNESDPYYHLWHETEKRIWWKYPSYKDPLGNRATVLSATRQKMQTIQRIYYVPNNSVLLVVGDVKPADIFAQARQLYAGWKQAEDPFKKHPLVSHPPIAKSEVVLVRQPVETVSMTLTWHGPSTIGKDVELTYAADLLGTALDEPSSKFQRTLVDSGACVRAGILWYTQMNTGPITLTLEATPDKADACVKAALGELPRLKAPDYLSDEEMRNAVHRLEVQQALERERPSQLAHVITFWWASAGLDYYRTYIDKLRLVSRADIARYLDSYVLGKPYVIGVMVSPAMEQDKGLGRTHFETLLGIPNTEPKRPAAPRKEASR